jgi:hypothetical protein
MTSIPSVDASFSTPAEELNQEKYQRSITTVDGYEHVHNEMEKKVHGLMESRVQPLSNGKGEFSEAIVDGCVKVKGVAEPLIKQQTEQWQKKKAEHEGSRNIGGFLTGFSFFVTGLASKQFGQGITLVCLICTVVHAVRAYILHSRATHAGKEADAWKNCSPAKETAQERTEAYKNGFLYAYSHQLKIEKEGASNKILHPLEVEGMYAKYFPEFYANLRTQLATTDKEQEQWINAFLSSNPLAPSLLKYGLIEIPAYLQAASDDFQQFNAYMQNLKGSIRDRQHQIRQEADKKIAENEEHKQKTLKPLSDKKEEAIAKAKEVYQETCRQYVEVERQKQALDAFNAAKKLYEDDYTKNTASIIKFFDDKTAELKCNRDALLFNLTNLQTTQISTFYKLARDLHSKAEIAYNEKSYTPINFQAYFNWQIPQQAAS